MDAAFITTVEVADTLLNLAGEASKVCMDLATAFITNYLAWTEEVISKAHSLKDAATLVGVNETVAAYVLAMGILAMETARIARIVAVSDSITVTLATN